MVSSSPNTTTLNQTLRNLPNLFPPSDKFRATKSNSNLDWSNYARTGTDPGNAKMTTDPLCRARREPLSNEQYQRDLSSTMALQNSSQWNKNAVITVSKEGSERSRFIANEFIFHSDDQLTIQLPRSFETPYNISVRRSLLPLFANMADNNNDANNEAVARAGNGSDREDEPQAPAPRAPVPRQGQRVAAAAAPDRNNREPASPPRPLNDPFPTVSEQFYQVRDAEKVLTEARIPFRPTGGLGSYIPASNLSMTDVLMNRGGDALPSTYGLNNSYAKYVGAMVLHHMHQRRDELAEGQADTPTTRVGEDISIDYVLAQEVNRLSALARHEPSTPGSRACRLFRSLLKGYNDEGNNSELDTIVRNFIEVRLGITGYDTDEYGAAIRAVLLKWEENNGVSAPRLSYWTLPFVHLLNGHLQAEQLPPIAFHPRMERNLELKRGHRALTSNTIWVINEQNEHVQAKVENRPEVIAEYVRWMEDNFGTVVAVAADVGPPPAVQDQDDDNDDRPEFIPLEF